MAYPDIPSGAAYWSTCKDGGAPAAGDTLYLNNGAILHLDGANASTYTCVAIKGATAADSANYNQSGYIVLDNATSTIAANIYGGNATSFISLTNKTLTVNDVYAGDSYAIYAPSGTNTIVARDVTGGYSGRIGIYLNGGTNTITFRNATGGAGTNASGITINHASSITCTGVVTGGSGSASGLVNFANISFTIPSAVGGGNAGAAGLSNYAGIATVTSAMGGTVAGACGAIAFSGGTVIVNGTDLTGVGYPTGNAGGTLKVAAGVPLQFSNAAGALKVFCPVPAANLVVLDTVLYTHYVAGEATNEYGTLASSIVDSVGAVTAAPGILDSAGARTAAPGILDVDGALHVYGVMAGDGQVEDEGVLESAGTKFYDLGSEDSTPYLAGDAARLALDVQAVGVELGNMTTAVVGLLDVGNDGTLNMNLYTLLEDVQTVLNTNKDEMIAANTDIQAAYSCDAGTAVAGGVGVRRGGALRGA